MLDFPIYDCVINLEDINTGVQFVSLTETPATKINWVALKEVQKVQLSIIEEEQQIICTCLVAAGVPIYRKNEKMGEHYIMFDAVNLRKMAEKMMIDNVTSNVNVEHIQMTALKDINLQEIYLKDVSRGINPVGFEDVADGSLFTTYKVHNAEVWQSIKDGTFTGLSIQGYLEYEKRSEETVLTDLINEAENILSTYKNLIK